MQAYCVKCKTKREMKAPEAVFTTNGAPGTRGECAVCGTNLFRMGATEAHEGMEKPQSQGKVKKKVQKGGRRSQTKDKHQRHSARHGSLVIVESPAKARTVGRYLGKGYTVKASVGHIRDLYKSKLSVDVENDFAPQYTVPRDKRTRAVVKELKEAAQRAAQVYLATDPDREGEAIAWHVQEVIGLSDDLVRRVVFHEITKDAVGEAFRHPRSINDDLVEAQQARRILDRLVGYTISPLLWRNVRRGLSAGRVQSVALRLVVEREREIEAFVPEEYWSISARLAKRDTDHREFTAKLHRIDDQEFTIASGEEAQRLVTDLETATWEVSDVQRGERRRRPSAPYTTSTLQQEASRRLNFNAQRTMRVAQALYEGINLGKEGAVGLITYMRTDSTNVSKEAQSAAREYIINEYGEAFVPQRPPTYSTTTRSAQEAHEAIRPTSVLRTPAAVKQYLNQDQFRLYKLIWMRFVASQMASAVYDTLTVHVLAGPEIGPKPYLFRASGSSLRFPGFLKVYEEARSEEDVEEDDLDILIPPLTIGELLDLLELLPKQHFTQPPARYSEATLVKALEQFGIGRPSTYASIISTILDRGYVAREERRLYPTNLGFVVNDMLVEHFDQYFNVNFTAQMEDDLDRIADGEQDWVTVMRNFYSPFARAVDDAGQNMQRQQIEPETIGEKCPECGGELVLREGRYGKFIGCANYPDCTYTRQLVFDIGVPCPLDGGRIVQKRSRRGRVFYGCDNWPECDFVSWNEPMNVTCPQCGKNLLTKAGKQARCADKTCGYSMNLEDAEKLARKQPEYA